MLVYPIHVLTLRTRYNMEYVWTTFKAGHAMSSFSIGVSGFYKAWVQQVRRCFLSSARVPCVVCVLNGHEPLISLQFDGASIRDTYTVEVGVKLDDAMVLPTLKVQQHGAHICLMILAV